MHYFVGSVLPIEWTNQHSCGAKNKAGEEVIHNVHCEIVLQYMCSPALRDGTLTRYDLFFYLTSFCVDKILQL